MGKQSACRKVIALLCLISSVIEASGQPGVRDVKPLNQPSSLSLSLRVINTAGVSRLTLDRAERVTAAVFRRIGVEVVWTYPEGEQAVAAAMAAATAQPRYYLRILRWPGQLGNRLDRHAGGFAPSGGCLIHVFYDSVKAEAEAGRLPEHMIFGYIVAHELGHIFLPPGYHSQNGVMRALLNQRNWRAASCGNLVFQDAEAARIREGILLARIREAEAGGGPMQNQIEIVLGTGAITSKSH